MRYFWLTAQCQIYCNLFCRDQDKWKPKGVRRIRLWERWCHFNSLTCWQEYFATFGLSNLKKKRFVKYRLNHRVDWFSLLCVHPLRVWYGIVGWEILAWSQQPSVTPPLRVMKLTATCPSVSQGEYLTWRTPATHEWIFHRLSNQIYGGCWSAVELRCNPTTTSGHGTDNDDVQRKNCSFWKL